MKELLKVLPTAGFLQGRKWMQRALPVFSEMSRRSIALALAGLMIPLGVSSMTAFAQEAPPPPPDQQGPPPDQGGPPPDDQAPPQQWNALSPDQLNQLVAPIALYPDSLVAQILAAATYPTQVVDADRFVEGHQGVPPDEMAQMVNGMQWDPSVKALAAFPSVLSNMDRNLDWMTQLGNAYYNQPQDVMSAVQDLRQQAYQAGHLRSTPQLNVTYAGDDDVEIEPANPAVVYVPYYNPWAWWGFRPYYAWYAPPPPRGVVLGVGIGFGFGIGVAVHTWGGYGWGWGHWGSAWGPHPYVAYNRVTYVSRSVTVVNHGYYGRFDRHPGAREYNVRAAHSAYNRGYAAGEHNGYNRSQSNGFNRGAAGNSYRAPSSNYRAPNNSYRAPANNTFNRGNESNNRGTQNYNRPAQNNSYSRPAQNNNYSRPQNNQQSRPAQNYNRPANNSRPANQARPQGNEHSRGGEKGGDKGEHPHGR